MNKLTMTSVALWLGTLLVSGTAFAQPFNGWVKGKVTFFESEFNFCNASAGVNQNCTDTTYTNADFGIQRPIKQAKVFVYEYDPATDTTLGLVGSGSTDLNGEFLIYWSISGHSVFNVRYTWHADHKDDRFNVRNTTGGKFIMTGTALTTKRFTSSSNPQIFPDKYWYDGTPHNPSNVYSGAWRTWNSFEDSTSLQAAWNGLQVRYGFSNGQAGPCGSKCDTACACLSGGTGWVHLTTAHPLENQARIQHEMGHIASAYLNDRRQIVDYCFPDTRSGNACVDGADPGTGTEAGGGSWNLSTGEWMNSAFEEGFATFLGDRAIYRQTNRCGSDPAVRIAGILGSGGGLSVHGAQTCNGPAPESDHGST